MSCGVVELIADMEEAPIAKDMADSHAMISHAEVRWGNLSPEGLPFNSQGLALPCMRFGLGPKPRNQITIVQETYFRSYI